MSLSEDAKKLQRVSHKLMYLGSDGTSVYSADLSRLNSEVYRLTTALYDSCVQGGTVEEQAEVCLALLMGYNASFIDHGEKREHVQEILNRCWDLLDTLPPSLLKLRLLTACYGEVYDEPLAEEAHHIIASWNPASLTSEQEEAIAELQNVMDNPYPWEEVE
ncbi:UpxZ family transcription anti-terminator antagonist [uncultured Bacteroides sp.]|uniref:UpxZ family transcription anti-terminator antagonist n=1 Tax=uncultured Bacteroides sp. TaxID=162156 RepID=UPI0025E86CDD|nr:UpxZ family transcription anti-terminator antagonist [uncultured Bacteroides sp.]